MANKQKSHKGVRKRFKVSAMGKVKYKRSFAGHLMSGKSGDRRRRMRRAGYIVGAEARRLIRALAE